MMLKPLRHRDQVSVGMITLVLLAAAMTGAFFFKDLPFGGGRSYSAHFAESAGITEGNEVHFAGVKVGQVTGVSLDGNRVLVHFTVEGVRLGSETTASIQIKTMLGEKYLKVESKGGGRLDPDKPIPVSRTSVPLDIPSALTKLTRTTEKLDTQQLAKSFRVLSETLNGVSKDADQALSGLAKLSKTVASRDEKLEKLLANAADVSKIVAQRSEQVKKLIHDGNLLLAELQQRKQAISTLLRETTGLAQQLRAMVAENRDDLRPALAELDKLTSMLQRNQDKLRKSIKALAPYIRAFTNTTGSGEWFDGYLCGLLPPPFNFGPIHTNPQNCFVPVQNDEDGAPDGGGR